MGTHVRRTALVVGALVSVAHRDSVRAFHTTRWVLDPQTRQLHVLPMAG